MRTVPAVALSVSQYNEEREREEEEEGMVWSVAYRQSPEPSSETDAPSNTCPMPVHDSSCPCLTHDRPLRTPKAGTVEKLVEHLAPFRTEVDVSYRTCFLATYRTFISAARLIELLYKRLAAC